MCFIQGQTLFWAMSQEWLVQMIWNEKEVHRLDMCDLDFDLTHDLDPGCFKVKFRNSCISGIFGLIDVKWKGNELIRYWADYITLTFDHTHDLDLWVSRPESEIA